MANASLAEEASVAWSQITEWEELYSWGGEATYVPVAECLRTLSNSLVLILVITVPRPLREAGIKHSRKVPVGRAPIPLADSVLWSCLSMESVSPFTASLPRSSLAKPEGNVNFTVHVDEAGSCIVATVFS
eukprot:1083606-Amphidinium_carterae.2